ncbi:glycosyltransferase family 8 protein [Chlorobaculum sp. 24CR]|uniref:glycosyltransferase family 8 protein n=1 Tax=Chlorobaculum sp. 24CR TaxID=2508878 RepID=UPI00100BBC9E|nr:glycosyltransferase family 8 protein [Chlorobaculum sp. 24CR]RXK85022.1 glycosyltransferase family 8 protein [Chlorobaculum sp. 24CR]
MNERVNIVFATDRNYIQHLAAALVSLLFNNRDVPFTVSIISSGMTPKDRRRIDEITKGHSCEIRHLTVSDDLFARLATEHPMYPKGIYYRLLIPSLIDEKRVLYLDSDIIVNGSIQELYNQEFGDAYVCAIEDPGFDRHRQLKMDASSRYFNSGMMLINLAKWKATGLQKKVIDFIENNPDAIWFPDQCGLNSVINGQWKKVPLKFNQQSSIFSEGFDEKFDCFSKEELREARANPIIIHYTGGSKPWHFRNRHPYKSLYWNYLKMTPYRRAIYSDLRPAHLFKSMIPKNLKTTIKKLLNKQTA